MTEKDTYLARVGCWNCSEVYDLSIKLGTNVPEHMINNEPKCKNCECTTLKMFNEYIAEKKIMKDLILHHRVESMSHEESPDPKGHSHIQ